MRYCPETCFPPYSYVPGIHPHPISSVDGHRAGGAELRWSGVVDGVEPCPPFLVGVDLFNHGYYWEAHEYWEAAWHAAGRRGRLADCLKGLIALAAAGVKSREGQPRGVAHHLERAARLLGLGPEPTAEAIPCWGLQREGLRKQIQAIRDDVMAVLDTRKLPVVVSLPIGLRLDQIGTGHARER